MRCLTVAGALGAILLALPVSPAPAGRILATGHDADYHCTGEAPPYTSRPACGFMNTAIRYVRDGAPDLTKPLLVIARPATATSFTARAVSRAGFSGFTIVLPTAAGLSSMLTTDQYSAVVIGTDKSCNGCSLNPLPFNADSKALWSNRAAFTSFFNDGGGVFALSGGRNALASSPTFAPTSLPGTGGFYEFMLPLPVGPAFGGGNSGYLPTGPTLTPPLTLFNTNGSNRPSHNSFTGAPPMTVVETHIVSSPPNPRRPVTVVAEGTVGPNGGLTPPPVAPPGLDHFKCYHLSPADARRRTVTLTDQFARRRVRVGAPEQVCNPVSKTVRRRSTSVLNPGAHLVCYATRDLPAGVANRAVRLRNQFGLDQRTTTTGSRSLCVPSRKRIVRAGDTRPPGGSDPERVLDHFRCYAVRPLTSRRTIGTRDQFATKTTRVLKLVRLCNPVQKTYRGETNKVDRKAAHLACYSIRDTTRMRKRNIVVRNQFERRRLRARQEATICLPTFKQVLAVSGTTAPGPTPVDPRIFTLTLQPSACLEAPGVARLSLSGATTPPRPGAIANVTLEGVSGTYPSELKVVQGADGAFTAQRSVTAPGDIPEEYEWNALVTAPDGLQAQAEAHVSLARGLPPCGR